MFQWAEGAQRGAAQTAGLDVSGVAGEAAEEMKAEGGDDDEKEDFEAIEAHMAKLRHLIAIRERAEASGSFQWAEGAQRGAAQSADLGASGVADEAAEVVRAEGGDYDRKEDFENRDHDKKSQQDQS